MLINVKYVDDGYDNVEKNTLDVLIDSNKIVEFERASGWVRIGVDPIRKTKRNKIAYQ